MTTVTVNIEDATWDGLIIKPTASGLIAPNGDDTRTEVIDYGTYLLIQAYDHPEKGDYFAKAYFSTNSSDPNAAIVEMEYYNEDGGLEYSNSDIYLTL